MYELKPVTKRDGPYLGRSVITVQSKDGEPNILWNLYQNGHRLILATCDDVKRLPTNWDIIDEFILDAIDFSIVFDGEWIYRDGRWKLQTEDVPYMFWVTTDGVLKVQKYGTLDILELATGVSTISTLRAWKNVSILQHDQGLIVSYIRNETIYYRAYCIQAETYEAAWEPEREVEYLSGNVRKANLFLLNDYRSGFAIEDLTGNIHWLVTHRNWASMAIGAENITLAAIASAKLVPVTYHRKHNDEIIIISMAASTKMLFANTSNSIKKVANIPVQKENPNGELYEDYGFKIGLSLTFPYKSKPSVVLKNAVTTLPFALLDVKIINENEFEIFIDSTVHEFGFNDVEGSLLIEVNGLFNEADYQYEPMSIEFAPVSLKPSFTPLPEVLEVWNE